MDNSCKRRTRQIKNGPADHQTSVFDEKKIDAFLGLIEGDP